MYAGQAGPKKQKFSGKGISGVGDKAVEMKQGDAMFVPRGEVHWFYSPFSKPVEMLFVLQDRH